MAFMNLWHDRRLSLAITRLGGQYLLAMLALGAFAVNSHNNLLYLVFSLMLGFFLVSGWVSRSALKGLRVVALEEGNLFARVRGGLKVRLWDAHPRRPRGLEIHLDMEEGSIEPGFLPGGQRQEEAVVVLHTRAERRGWTRISQLELRTSYPFGFLEKRLRFPLDKRVLVLPHPRNSRRALVSRGHRRRQEPVVGDEVPEGSRPLRPGEALSRMHWKRSAQKGQPWLRTFEGEDPQGLDLLMDLRRWGPGGDFEKELERISGAILHARLQKQQVSLTLLGKAQSQRRDSPTECWKILAEAQAEGLPEAKPLDTTTSFQGLHPGVHP